MTFLLDKCPKQDRKITVHLWETYLAHSRSKRRYFAPSIAPNLNMNISYLSPEHFPPESRDIILLVRPTWRDSKHFPKCRVVRWIKESFPSGPYLTKVGGLLQNIRVVSGFKFMLPALQTYRLFVMGMEFTSIDIYDHCFIRQKTLNKMLIQKCAKPFQLPWLWRCTTSQSAQPY